MMKVPPQVSLTISPSGVSRVLYLVTAILSMVHIIVLCIYFWVNDENQFDFIRLVDMDYEANIPTLYSVTLFLIAAFLLGILWRYSTHIQSRDRLNWLGMTFIFVFLGIDEGAKLHEYVGDWMENFIAAEGFLYFPWVIPYTAILAVVTVFYFPFYLRLDTATKKGFLIAAVLFLTGAMFFDSLGGKEAHLNGTRTIKYSVLYTIEEILEMTGLTVFIRTLIVHTSRNRIRILF